jgi:copper chaperone CopZ
MSSSNATYTVIGMTCNGCVNKVSNAVMEVAGVEDVDVDVSTGTLDVFGEVDNAAILSAVAGVGYQIAD